MKGVGDGCLPHTIQRAKLQATRHPSWVLRDEELRHVMDHWGGKSPGRSLLEQGMMGSWGQNGRADKHVTLSACSPHF